VCCWCSVRCYSCAPGECMCVCMCAPRCLPARSAPLPTHTQPSPTPTLTLLPPPSYFPIIPLYLTSHPYCHTHSYPSDQKPWRAVPLDGASHPLVIRACMCFCSREWMRLHLCNDWLAGCWFIYWYELTQPPFLPFRPTLKLTPTYTLLYYILYTIYYILYVNAQGLSAGYRCLSVPDAARNC
jgi:hypothetical protein